LPPPSRLKCPSAYKRRNDKAVETDGEPIQTDQRGRSQGFAGEFAVMRRRRSAILGY